MAQLQWTVPGLGGKQYLLGMYHGEDSGHLMVHCNNKVMLVDFGVKDAKEYSFFLDTELFELKITRENGAFAYDMIHNEEVDTPHNRRREQEKKTNRWRIIAGGVLALIIILVLALQYFRAPANNAVLLQNLAEGRTGITTQASIFKIKDRWYANYRADNQVEEVALIGLREKSPLGFPLAVGDQLTVRYAVNDPDLFVVEWKTIGPVLQERYRKLTIERHGALNPDMPIRQLRCQVDLAIELEGVDGLAKLYQQDQKDSELYNTDAYLRLIRSTAFRQGMKECL